MRWSILIVGFLSALPAQAAPYSWSVLSVDEDPFTKGVRVVADYTTSERSAIRINCDSSKIGLTVWIIPGFTMSEEMRTMRPTVATAIDGVLMPEAAGNMYVIGDNLAMIQTELTQQASWRTLKAMSGAKRQIAFNDGISAVSHLLSAEGVANASATLMGCLTLQAPKM